MRMKTEIQSPSKHLKLNTSKRKEDSKGSIIQMKNCFICFSKGCSYWMKVLSKGNSMMISTFILKPETSQQDSLDSWELYFIKGIIIMSQMKITQWESMVIQRMSVRVS